MAFKDKDFIEEGPFRALAYDFQVDDPSVFSNVTLWLSSQSATYWLAQGVQTTDQDGNVVYEFNGDTLAARRLTSDGTLEVEYDEQGGTLADIKTAFESGQVATITTKSDHGYSVGDFVQIEGTTSYDGVWEITSIVDTDTFKFALCASASTESQGTTQKVKEVPKTVAMPTEKRYDAEVTVSIPSLAIDHAVAVAELLVREVHSIPNNVTGS